jgi:triosephosphate isomerase
MEGESMKTKLVAGNWKMHKTNSEAEALVKELLAVGSRDLKTEILLCPPYTALSKVVELVKGTRLKVGAQNLFWELEGAYTGEISAPMIKSTGATHVIVGHSERRKIFHEHDLIINRKLRIALKEELIPILCVGETLEERETGLTKEVVGNQIEIAFRKIGKHHAKNVIIAYEPVWAIGTGKTATPEQAQEVHAFIRDLITTLYDQSLANEMYILYGGSVKPGNAYDLMKQKDIDGALVGGACLKSDSFISIIEAAERTLG